MPIPPFSANPPQASLKVSGKVKQTAYNVYDLGAKGDGFTDDSKAFNDAFTLAASSGLPVHAPVGNYYYSSNINVVSGVKFFGSGYGTKMIPANGVSIVLNTLADIIIESIRFDGSNQSINQTIIQVTNPIDVTVQNCWLVNCVGFGIFTQTSGNSEWGKCRYINSYYTGYGNNDLIGGGPADTTSTLSELIITGNYLTQGLPGGGAYGSTIDLVARNKTVIANNIMQGRIFLSGEVIPHYCTTIANNILRPPLNATFSEIGILMASAQTVDSQNITIIGNQVINGIIFLQGQSGTNNYTRKVIIANNNITAQQNNVTPDANWAIDLQYLRDVEVVGNIIDTATYAIYASNVVGMDVSNNRFLNCTNLINSINGTAGVTGHNNAGLNPDLAYALGNISGATTFNRINGYRQSGTLNGSITVTLTAGIILGDSLTLELIQDGTGNRTATWPANFKKAGGSLTLSTAAGAIDIINIYWDGTNWVETSRALNIS